MDYIIKSEKLYEQEGFEIWESYWFDAGTIYCNMFNKEVDISFGFQKGSIRVFVSTITPPNMHFSFYSMSLYNDLGMIEI